MLSIIPKISVISKKFFLAMRTPVLGEPSAVCGFQFTFPCVQQIYLASVSTQDTSTKKNSLAWFFSSDVLVCGFTG